MVTLLHCPEFAASEPFLYFSRMEGTLKARSMHPNRLEHENYLFAWSPIRDNQARRMIIAGYSVSPILPIDNPFPLQYPKNRSRVLARHPTVVHRSIEIGTGRTLLRDTQLVETTVKQSIGDYGIPDSGSYRKSASVTPSRSPLGTGRYSESRSITSPGPSSAAGGSSSTQWEYLTFPIR